MLQLLTVINWTVLLWLILKAVRAFDPVWYHHFLKWAGLNEVPAP